eukprot:TRINITY_DN6974_c0_g1_i1.p1 TRINITY_DN6974_c0_g1~~TRINITY_DN6974_c0_g1_i1.p1  ORF type:complete len:118 (-),score=29.11 TRINITY_DN6974_c0_g1_i1:16-369(-)
MRRVAKESSRCSVVDGWVREMFRSSVLVNIRSIVVEFGKVRTLPSREWWCGRESLREGMQDDKRMQRMRRWNQGDRQGKAMRMSNVEKWDERGGERRGTIHLIRRVKEARDMELGGV